LGYGNATANSVSSMPLMQSPAHPHNTFRKTSVQMLDVLITDEWRAYKSAVGDIRHERVNHTKKEYVRVGTDIHTNTVESAFSLLKRGIIGSWHKVSAKHLAAYLDEMTFRFNRRKNANLFLDTLRHMVTAPVLAFEKLTA
jgi:hypothetical protein